MRRIGLGTTITLATFMAALAPTTAVADEVPVTLRGSLRAMERQHDVALGMGYPFARTVGDLVVLEEEGQLVRMEGNDDYGFRVGVESLLARPEMEVFIERLSADYRAACEEKLVVTSLTRPTTRQPPNAHRLSVHPAGIAVDLRVSRRAMCRSWLESTLLAMEEAALLDVTKERYPPHYHVALFPDRYMEAVAAERAAEARARAALLAASGPPPELVAAPAAGAAADRRWGVLAVLPAAAVGVLVLRRRGGSGA